MRVLRRCVGTAAVLTLILNANSVARLYQHGFSSEHAWSYGFRGASENVDAARRMTVRACAAGGAVAYCPPYDGWLTPVDRSRILAMSWETAPLPVTYGRASEFRGCDYVVSSAHGVEDEMRNGLGDQYHIVDTDGGLNLWSRAKKDYLPRMGEMLTHTFGGIVATAVLAAFVGLLFCVGRAEGVVFGVGLSTVLTFVQAICLQSIDPVWHALVLASSFAVVWILRRIGILRGAASVSTLRGNGQRERAVCVCLGVALLCAYGVLTLTHTFVAPNGLGTVGGKARLMLLARGFPPGFFVDPTFMLYQPAYPPGGALFLLGGYMITGICDEWMIQLLNCLLMSMLAFLLFSRVRNWALRLLVLAFFLSPLAVRLATLLYPEVWVGLCVIAGWVRIRRNSLDWAGWFAIGLSGWFKNEGIVYLCVLACASLIFSRRNERLPILPRVCCAIMLPLSWHIGCRTCGASLDGYSSIFAASPLKGWLGLLKLVSYSFLQSWRYAFVFPMSAICFVWGSFRPRAFKIAWTGTLLAFCAFSVIYAMSSACDFSWHLESAERVLWVPALLLLYEILEFIREPHLARL